MEQFSAIPFFDKEGMPYVPRRRVLLGLGAFGTGCVLGGAGAAQEMPDLKGKMSDEDKKKLNDNRVGLITGGPGGRYLQFGVDLARLLDNHKDLSMRVVVMFGKGSLQNINDLYNLRSVDAAIVQADVLHYIKQLRSDELMKRGLQDIEKRVAYITRLYNEEVHVLGRYEPDGRKISELKDLDSKKVNLSEPNSGTYLTAKQVLRRAGIKVDERTDSDEIALNKLKHGEIDALFFVTAKPAPFFSSIRPQEANEAKLHFLVVPELVDDEQGSFKYEGGSFTHADYPGLVPEDTEVATIAAPAVLAVYNWEPSKEKRYQALVTFTQRLLEHIESLASLSPFTKYKEIDPRATVSDLTRFAAAEEWLTANPRGSIPAKNCRDVVTNDLLAKGIDPADVPVEEMNELGWDAKRQGRC
ncbi:MAG: TAXI family TRAP transporter solute-binding subunit [Geminicoccaceae bacterium]